MVLSGGFDFGGFGLERGRAHSLGLIQNTKARPSRLYFVICLLFSQGSLARWAMVRSASPRTLMIIDGVCIVA